PRRPQCPQHPVRLRRKGLDDRLRPLPHAHPGHRLARAQPGAAAAIAAQAGGAGGPRGGRCRLRAPAPGLRRALGPGDLTMAAAAAPAWALRFQGVGNASATELGTPMATIERAGAPWLTIDCGSEGLSAYLDHYGEPPRAIFVTHVHLDHVGGFERLFVSEYFDPARRGRMPLYVPAPVVPLLHRRGADYPNGLPEGGGDLLGRVPAGAGGRGVLARRPARGGVPAAPPLARHRLRPAPARQPALPGRHPADPGATAAPRRCRGAGGARLRPARQSVPHRNRRSRARIPARTDVALRALPLRVPGRRRGAGRARLPGGASGRGVRPGRAGGAGRRRMSMAPQPPAAPRDRLGRPLRDLRLSVIEACNFRCGYCMPADRVPDDYGLDAASRLSFGQIETLVRAAARLGVTKLRLTGGEPLLRKGLAALVARLARVGGIEDLAMTTNGALLAPHAAALRAAGLRRLTVSLDALDPD